MSNDNGWIGVDLDGTLAYYDSWKSETNIGAPIMFTVLRIKKWLEEGRTVKIFTARVATENEEELKAVRGAIEKWCELHIGQKLEVTCKKDYQMIKLVDDRAEQVVQNQGIPLELLLKTLVTRADTVMKMLEANGPSIVPHLIDSDENPGEELRKLIKHISKIYM